jgi:hypothetical protein
MEPRYKKFQHLVNGFVVKKFNQFTNNSTKLSYIKIQAGLYKLNRFYNQHKLIFSSLVSDLAFLAYQKHGKRKKLTVSLNAILFKNQL